MLDAVSGGRAYLGLARAGEVFDEIKVGGSANPAVVSLVLDRVRAQVAALAQRVLDAGAGRVEFGGPHGLTDAGGVDLLGREVLPLLRR